MSVAKRIRECRYAKGWGPDELAQHAQISRTALYQIESGKTETPRASTLNRVAQALGVTVESLLGTAPLPRQIGEDVNTPPAFSVVTQPKPESAPRPLRPSGVATVKLGAVSPLDCETKLRKILESPYADSVIQIIDEVYRLLPLGQGRAQV